MPSKAEEFFQALDMIWADCDRCNPKTRREGSHTWLSVIGWYANAMWAKTECQTCGNIVWHSAGYIEARKNEQPRGRVRA